MKDAVRDRYGRILSIEEARKVARSRPPGAKGYASAPGLGPAGETCKSCRHYARVQGGARVYLKCLLMRDQWTRGPGTDIKAGSPACQRWEKPDANGGG